MLFTITTPIRMFVYLNVTEDNWLFLLSISIAGNIIAVLTANILPTEGDSPTSGFSSFTQSYLSPRYVM